VVDSRKEEDDDYDGGFSSSNGILAQALIAANKDNKDSIEDCIEATETPTEAPLPAEIEHKTELKNLFYAHILILVVLFVVLVANAKEGKACYVVFPFTTIAFLLILFNNASNIYLNLFISCRFKP